MASHLRETAKCSFYVENPWFWLECLELWKKWRVTKEVCLHPLMQPLQEMLIPSTNMYVLQSFWASYPCQNSLPKADGPMIPSALKHSVTRHFGWKDLQTLSCLKAAHKSHITCCFLPKLPTSPQVTATISFLTWPQHFLPATMAIMRLQQIV